MEEKIANHACMNERFFKHAPEQKMKNHRVIQ